MNDSECISNHVCYKCNMQTIYDIKKFRKILKFIGIAQTMQINLTKFFTQMKLLLRTAFKAVIYNLYYERILGVLYIHFIILWKVEWFVEKLNVRKKRLKGLTEHTYSLNKSLSKSLKPRFFFCQQYFNFVDGWSTHENEVLRLVSLNKNFYLVLPEPLDWESFWRISTSKFTSYQQQHSKNKLHSSDVLLQYYFLYGSQKQKPFTVKDIESKIGGLVSLNAGLNSKICVQFFKDLFTEPSTIRVSIECLYFDAFYVSQNFLEENNYLLVSPIVKLGPSPCTFTKCVKVTLPLCKGEEYLLNGKMIVMYSETEVGQQPQWMYLNTECEVDMKKSTVTFNTYHFTMFAVFWNILDSTLPEQVKLHATSHLPHFSFWVEFRVLMTEYRNNEQFGLCVVCSRFGSQVPQVSAQYPHEVGICKPRKIRTGKLRIQLKSGLFAPDRLAGETSLTKYIDFGGHDFDVHYACVFNSKDIVDVGLFGKVVVNNLEEELSFNLIQNCEPKDIYSCTQNQEIKNLTETLGMEDYLWHEVAISLGYTRSEIRRKFSSCKEPLSKVLADFMSRGGQYKEYFDTMCKVARIFKLKETENEECQAELGSYCIDLEETSAKKNESPRKRKHEETYTKQRLSESDLDDIAGEISRNWMSVGRKLLVTEHEIREINLNFRHCGEKEKAFQMLHTWKEREPDNCHNKYLSNVLNKSGLKQTARNCLY